MRLLFLYFSGTGNTDYVARYLADRVAKPGLAVELRSIEWQPAETVKEFDLLAVGFPVYAGDAPSLMREYIEKLPPGGGRPCIVFCTQGAWAAGALRLNLQRLAARAYVPVAKGSVTMPGSDGLAMVSKDSWLARNAIEKDYDHLRDADRLAEQLIEIVHCLESGQSMDELRLPLPSGSNPRLTDKAWALAYGLAESWAQDKFRATAQCEGCGLCARLCPVDNIQVHSDGPSFSDKCLLCMRCLHACPKEAIQIGTLTRGKFRWHGPKGAFEAIRMRPRRGAHS
jgi:ferredoxin